MDVQSQYQAWASQRPVFSRLPQVGYQDNSVADWLTSWVDIELTNKKQQLEQFYTQLSPQTCASTSLDYLAFLVGLSGDYWSVNWTDVVKRQMIASATNIFSSRGTVSCITQVLTIVGVNAKLWWSGQTIVSFQLPVTLGSSDLRLFIRLPIQYQRNGYEWQEAQRVRRCYVPAMVSSMVCYDKFYLGMSRLGEPVFK